MNSEMQKQALESSKKVLGVSEHKFTSADLFGNTNSVLIDHRGVMYTLRITQFGKLILTK